MIGVLLTLQVVLIWLVWDTRRVLRMRAVPSLPKPVPSPGVRAGFAGAVPPASFTVVRWPDGHHFYDGCDGAAARKMYEHTHPKPGEEVELWHLGDRRGHKVG